MSRKLALSAALATGMLSCGSGAAHEFWIEPYRGVVEPGSPIVADLMVGVLLNGAPYPYIPEYVVKFDVTAGGKTVSVASRAGDKPALHVDAREGLHIIAHQTVPFRTTHESWNAFQTYVREEGFPEIETWHLARGLPLAGFSEGYVRYAKALVQAGPVVEGDGDFPVGMPYEIVAEANPFGGGDELTVQLLWNGRPVADAQIAVLRDGEPVTRTAIRTDEQGRARVPLAPGFMLLSAVRMQPIERGPAAWLSHWAALSFRVDVRD